MAYNYNEVSEPRAFIDSVSFVQKLEVKGFDFEDEEIEKVKEDLPENEFLFESDCPDDYDLEAEEKLRYEKLLNKILEFKFN